MTENVVLPAEGAITALSKFFWLALRDHFTAGEEWKRKEGSDGRESPPPPRKNSGYGLVWVITILDLAASATSFCE